MCGLHLGRLTFPTIHENESVVAVLPSFLEICGRKMDQGNTVMDRGFLEWLHVDVHERCFETLVLQDKLDGNDSNQVKESGPRQKEATPPLPAPANRSRKALQADRGRH